MQDQTQQLDPSIVNLAKSISKVETNGQSNPYTAKGGSGEYGAYQYTAPTWATDSQKYLGQSIPLEQATPAQQDEVAYKKIEDLGKQGYKPNQIASIWNSGKPDPTGNVGTNKYGVNYNTPQYVKSVGDVYSQLQGGQTPTPSVTASTVAPSTTNDLPQNLQDIVNSSKNNLPTTPIPSQSNPELQAGDPTTLGGSNPVTSGIISAIGGGKLAQGLGYALSNLSGTQDKVTQSLKSGSDIETNLMKQIQLDKAQGKDTTRLQNALAQLTSDMQDTANKVSDVGTGGLLKQNDSLLNNDITKSGLQLGITALAGAAPSAFAKSGEVALSSIGDKALAQSVEDANFTNSLSGGVAKSVADMSAIEKETALTKAMQATDSPSIKRALLQDLEKIKPLADIEMGIAPSTASKIATKAGGLLKQGAKGALRVGADVAGLGVLKNFIK